MKVLVVLKTNEGGLWAVPHVEELRNRGHGVTVVIPPGPGRLRRALDAAGVPVLESPFDFGFRPSPRLLRGLARLRRLIREHRPDVVHYHLYASALAVRFATVGTGIARVHMVAGPLYLESPLIRAAERLLVRLDDVTIGGSDHTADLYRALGRGGDTVRSVPYGVDTDRFTPPADALRQESREALGVADDELLVVMIAYVYAPKTAVHTDRGIKGHDVLLEAWRRFVADGRRARLLLVGAGFDAAGEAHRSALRERFGIDADPTVSWQDSVEDVRSAYAAADLSVSPSLSENHGAALEAGASGVPSIVSDAGALPEAVPADAGWVVSRGDADALLRALEDADDEFRASALAGRGEAARRHVVTHFDRRAAAARVADILEEVGRPGRRA
jgi:glycosyltransferase involved in cell wall biosynthesis